MLRKASRIFLLILTLAALPLLVGSKCVFIFSSGGGSNDHRDGGKDNSDKDTIQPAAINSGSFGDPPVEGVSFASGSLAGVTGGTASFSLSPATPSNFLSVTSTSVQR